MANKAIGKILTPDIPFGIKTGDTVTIMLEKGMKVIGTCVQCKLYEECGIMEALIYCENKHWKKFAKVGCGLWKPKKGAK